MGVCMYDLNTISNYLNTNIIGKSIIQYDDLNSTFMKAKNIFATCPDGTIVLSEDQSDCILRWGNKWTCTPDKNIYLSIILKSVYNNYLVPLLDVVACSSIIKAIMELYNLKCEIKWPNDILVNNKKIASVKSDIVNKGAGLILSININVNIDEEAKALDASSIKIEKGEDVEREHLMGKILSNIDDYYDLIISTGKAKDAVDLYNENLFNYNKEVNISKKGRKTIRKSTIKHIDSEGWLVVIDKKGQEEILSPGEMIIQYEEA